ncbi:MAG: flagellar FlbD family protein [Candidatus Cybelea sp.]|jgi:flagellar protein FlbD
MITLTRLNGRPVMLNCDLIESIEEDGHTVVTLTTGNAVVVRDPMAEVEAKIVAFKRKIFGPA